MLKPRGVYEEVAAAMFYELIKHNACIKYGLDENPETWDKLPEHDKEMYRDIAYECVKVVDSQ